MKKIIIVITVVSLVAVFIAVDTAAKMNVQENISKEDCVLNANQEYTNSIKEAGTPMTINGKEYSGLDTSEWVKLDKERMEKVSRCNTKE